MDSRHNKNLQDVLKFAVKYQEGDKPADMHELDTEKKEYLEAVLKSMTVDVMENVILALQMVDSTSTTDEEKIEYLGLIRDYIDNIDTANSLAKIGGTNVIMKCTKSENLEIRVSAYNVLAELAQNNPFCQRNLLEMHVMKPIITALEKEQDNVRASCLYALTSIMSNFEPALNEFIQCGGVLGVLRCLDSESSRVFTKACFFISSLSSIYSLIRNEFLKSEAFKALAKNFEVVSDFDIKTEALLIAMSTLAQSGELNLDDTSVEIIRKDLESLINNTQGLEQCEEMVEHSKIILTNLK